MIHLISTKVTPFFQLYMSFFIFIPLFNHLIIIDIIIDGSCNKGYPSTGPLLVAHLSNPTRNKLFFYFNHHLVKFYKIDFTANALRERWRVLRLVHYKDKYMWKCGIDQEQQIQARPGWSGKRGRIIIYLEKWQRVPAPRAARPTLCFRPSLRADSPSVVTRKFIQLFFTQVFFGSENVRSLVLWSNKVIWFCNINSPFVSI